MPSCQLHISVNRTAQIYLELHFCVELHTKKKPCARAIRDVQSLSLTRAISCTRVKPNNAQRKTELNSTVQFSFPLCIEPATKLAVVAGSSQSGHTLGQPMQCLSLDDNRRRAATTGDARCRFLTVRNLRRPSPVVSSRRRFNSQRKTELN